MADKNANRVSIFDRVRETRNQQNDAYRNLLRKPSKPKKRKKK